MIAAWWARRGKKDTTPDLDAIEAELEHAVAEEIESRLGPYLDSGDATLITHSYPNVVSMEFEIVPTNPNAAQIYVSVSGDEVVMGLGSGVVELFAERRGEWQPGARRGSAHYSRLTYETADGPEEPPELGERISPPWEAH